MKLRSLVGALAIVALSASGLVFAAPVTAPVVAAEASQFDPGNIISDAQFFDGAAMGPNEVQNFLMSQVPVCRSNYACLTTYRQNTPTMPASSGRCDTYQGRSNETAADIIARVGAACGISQKVMLVLLEKEQSLVTSATSSQGRFTSATGMGCPDTAACDPSVAGFFYQVYFAARQFKIYSTSPNSFNHVAGRVNNVRFHPNADCGSSAVYIANQATAGLYNYTPYQPNAAALANMYGTGDGCSAYGNRNFWRIFTDWFGSPTAGSALLRTLANPQVYLISGNRKYPVNSASFLRIYAPLGAVDYVQQSVLDRYSTAQPANRIFRDEGGRLFFTDAGMKLPFSTCGDVIDYGGKCDPSGFVQLTSAQAAAFATGPTIGPVLGTRSGGRYYITLNTKREISDERAQVEASIPAGMNVLTDDAVSDMSLGAPITRDSIFVNQRGGGNYFFISAGQKMNILGRSDALVGPAAITASSLSYESIQRLPTSSTPFTGIVRGVGISVSSVLSPSGRYDLVNGAVGSTTPTTPVTTDMLSAYPYRGSISPGSFVTTATGGVVYAVTPTAVRAVPDWATLLTVAPSGSPTILTVTSGFVEGSPSAPPILQSGALVNSPSTPNVYLVNGLNEKIVLDSFDTAAEAGIRGSAVVGDGQLAAYKETAGVLGYRLTCGSKSYISAGGSIHELTGALPAAYGGSSLALDPLLCQRLTVGSPATQFIHTNEGAIYLVSNGQKRHILNYDTYLSLGGAVGFQHVSDGFSATLPTGADI
ncbi:hypothetical protein [Agreia sp. VKM Ac-1783]|uniref:hypothetical protein n=1 Tax=Agreia sp. VKM Ac-1783 TaxID=1938889 RepID=UPI000A2AA654|nr:hypothetical protein [Agreia sp. VKM Ac-1783]SMQ60600.1 hypothetical protein SAMN06295943_0493 [Agreia sp. VKM Ac-1783]